MKKILYYVLTLFSGRMHRLNLLKNWLFMIVGFVVFVLSLGEYLPDGSYYGTFGTPDFSFATAFFLFLCQTLYIFWIILMLSILTRRWHDIGYGGWVLLILVPMSFVPLVFLFVLFLRGDEKVNRYGESPLESWSLEDFVRLKYFKNVT